MAEVNKIEKKTVLNTKYDIVQYQLITYCFIKDINLTEADLDCLTTLVLSKDRDLNLFCKQKLKYFKSEQSIRNCLRKCEVLGLIYKTGKKKKKIYFHENINLVYEGNILLNYNFLFLETN